MKTAADLLSTSENPRLQWFRKDSLFLCQIQSPEQAVQAFCRSQAAFACSMQVQASLLKVISQGPRAAEASRWHHQKAAQEQEGTAPSGCQTLLRPYHCPECRHMAAPATRSWDMQIKPSHQDTTTVSVVIVAGRLAS
uniref:Uncharacterized protein n=1 Tax=Myotis myotis TaxID=51298 RepID=A0A7J7Y0M8_MYOMY|nr:hypothetical protein mMyoMyo1_011504 [Myotis myotis]